ncbi:hypothetical protein SCHPADRAFT_905938 [Schizopora paradoxa]|uniref:Ubiquitin-like domain-containing protein n=1 Tax=Schizopora paradoxa TaxID=27342 RepID=A0A0H2RIP9_9AGAM|nr:hypothetical protein SCHPADRAFT_905938 [Schizopora paradoxa]
MPAVRSTSTKSELSASGSKNALPLVARHNGNSVTVPRHGDFKQSILFIRKNIKDLESIGDDEITVFAKIPTFGDEKIKIAPETWSDVVGEIRELLVWVEIRDTEIDSRKELAALFRGGPIDPADPDVYVEVTHDYGSGSSSITRSYKTSTKVGTIMQESGGSRRAYGVAKYKGRLINGDQTLQELGFQDLDVLEALHSRTRSKPKGRASNK